MECAHKQVGYTPGKGALAPSKSGAGFGPYGIDPRSFPRRANWTLLLALIGIMTMFYHVISSGGYFIRSVIYKNAEPDPLCPSYLQA